MSWSSVLRSIPKSRWLVAALVLVGLAAIGAVWHLSTYRTRRVLREIEALNGLARAAYQIDTAIPGMSLKFGPIDHVYLLGPQTDDLKLEILEDVPQLRILTLTNTRVTDEGLARLARFRNLNCLYVGNIDHTKLIGSAGERLATRPLAGGKGLGALKDLPNLQVVQLIGPGTSDDDLEGLAQLKQLRLLDLKDTRVTKEGIAGLKKILPNCAIRFQ
jgi:hypothetical protein